MKRLLIRMAALATVVVLGLIAIAQAQRGVKDSPEEAEKTKKSSPLRPDEGAPKPILADDAGGTSGSSASGTWGNPLRREPVRTVHTDAIPAAEFAIDSTPAGDYPAGPSFGGQSPAARPADPFGAHRAGGEMPAMDLPVGPGPMVGPANEQFISTEAPMEDTSSGATGGDIPFAPPATAPSRYPQLVSPAKTGAPALGAPVAESFAPAPVGNRDGSVSEPAPFHLDPSSPSTSIGEPPARLDDRYAIPGAEMSPLEPAMDGASPSGAGTGRPGNRQLEGPQAPQVTIQKFAPAEIQVGKPATFQVKVLNTGQVAAYGVEIRDEVPGGTRLLSTNPRASRGARGELVWALGTMKPGEETTVAVELMPTEEGEIGSVASVHFNADASVRTLATKPELVIRSSAPSRVLIGEEMTLTITLSNPGSGIATGVVLEERVPPGLQHSAGVELEYEVGDLKPKESRQLQLTLVAARPGPLVNVLTARGDANLKTEDRLEIEVVAPRLDVALEGPKRRYLEREATYVLSVSNPGTAPARQVEVVAQLPRGLDFVSANNAGHYEAATRTVCWQLEELPVNETGTVQMVTMPVEAGEHALRFGGSAERGLTVEKEHPVLIEGIAAILFQVADVADPIEVGGETTYEIRVLNQGSKAATNVRLVAMLPPAMRPVAAEGPTRHAIEAGRVLFEGLPRLAPKADTTYRVRVQGLQPGDQRISVQLLTDEIRTPVTKEESTRVYSDE